MQPCRDVPPEYDTVDPNEARQQRQALDKAIRDLVYAADQWEQRGNHLHQLVRETPGVPFGPASAEEWYEGAVVVDRAELAAQVTTLAAETMRAYGIAGHYRRKLAELRAEAADLGVWLP